MAPFLILMGSTLLLRAAGAAGVTAFESWMDCLRMGLAAMFVVTASAHWGRRRSDLIRMVPAAFPRPDLLVSVTGGLEILGATGLLIPGTARIAAVCLALLLFAMFPANVNAARRRLTLGGAPVTSFPLRTVLQVVFICALAAVSFLQI